MKRILMILCALCAIVSCDKTFETSIDLGVNDTRINIPWANAQNTLEFSFPVYSNGSWSAELVAGGDWLRISDASGEGSGCIHCTSTPNLTGVPRAVKMEVTGSGKTIPVFFVISSQDVAASDLEDADLVNYLI